MASSIKKPVAKKIATKPVSTFDYFEFPSIIVARLVRGEATSQLDRIRTVFDVHIDIGRQTDSIIRCKITGASSDVELVTTLLTDISYSANLLVQKRKYDSKFDLKKSDFDEIREQLNISIPVLSAHRGREQREEAMIKMAVQKAIEQMRNAVGIVANNSESTNKTGLVSNFTSAGSKKSTTKVPLSSPALKTYNQTGRPEFTPYHQAQAIGFAAITSPDIHVAYLVGEGGGGKTRLALEAGYFLIKNGLCKRFELYRPDQGAGNNPGSVPGNIVQKDSLFLGPLSDELKEVTGKTIEEGLKSGLVKDAGTPFKKRGATFTDSFVLIDEAQNLTISQARLLLTRLGRDSKVIIAGDISNQQNDLEGKCAGLAYLVATQAAGFNEAKNYTRQHTAFIEFGTEASDARHPLLPSIHENFNNLSPEMAQALKTIERVEPDVDRATEIFMIEAKKQLTEASLATSHSFMEKARTMFPDLFIPKPQAAPNGAGLHLITR